MRPKVQVLLSTYNGENYLEELLESVFSQVGVDVSIFVRDDGSTDNTISILNRWSKKYNIKLIYGTNIGYAKSFWTLVENAPEADYYAFCDQDDLWIEDKLLCAIKLLENNESVPALYTCNVDSIDSKGKVIQRNAFPFSGTQNFRASLLKSVLPGCTFIFNNSLLIKMRQYKGLVISHDWLTYIIAAGVGKIIYGNEAKLQYRLHDHNTIGTQSSLKLLCLRFKNFLCPKFPNGRSMVALNILNSYYEELSNEDIRVAQLFGNCKIHRLNCCRLLKYKEFRNLILMLLILLGKA